MAEFFSKKDYEIIMLDNFIKSEIFKKDKKISKQILLFTIFFTLFSY